MDALSVLHSDLGNEVSCISDANTIYESINLILQRYRHSSIYEPKQVPDSSMDYFASELNHDKLWTPGQGVQWRNGSPWVQQFQYEYRPKETFIMNHRAQMTFWGYTKFCYEACLEVMKQGAPESAASSSTAASSVWS